MTARTDHPSADPRSAVQQPVDHQTPEALLREENKATLFAVLRTAGITHLAVQFHGYGNSGRIEVSSAKAHLVDVEIPPHAVSFRRPASGSAVIHMVALSIEFVAETLAHEYLDDRHAGWERGDGSCGHVIFDVKAGKVTLTVNERRVHYTAHTWTF